MDNTAAWVGRQGVAIGWASQEDSEGVRHRGLIFLLDLAIWTKGLERIPGRIWNWVELGFVSSWGLRLRNCYCLENHNEIGLGSW